MGERDQLYVKEGDKTFYTAWIDKNVKNVKFSSSSTARTVKNVQIYNFWLHCKYIQFFIMSTFHCNLAVRFTLIALSSAM